jgi:hypothetical protein
MGIAARIEQESGGALSRRLRVLRDKPCIQTRFRAENKLDFGPQTRELGSRSGPSAEA